MILQLNLYILLHPSRVRRGGNSISGLSSVFKVLGAYPITGRVRVNFSVKSASWSWHRTLEIRLAVTTDSDAFAYSSREPAVSIPKASGGFYRTLQHKLAEL